MKFRTIIFDLAALLVVCLVGCSASESARQAVPESKTFGQRQVEQMLDDRPDMKGVMPMSDPVVQWVIESFDGKYLGQRIYWNGGSPQGGRYAENYDAPQGGMAYVAVTGGTEITPIDRWTAVIFELHNIQNDFQPIVDKAVQGDLDEEAFANEGVKLELEAVKKTQDFLLKNPLPKSSHGRDSVYNTMVRYSETYKSLDDYKTAVDNLLTPEGKNNFDYWRRYYRENILPYVVHKPDEGKDEDQAKAPSSK